MESENKKKEREIEKENDGLREGERERERRETNMQKFLPDRSQSYDNMQFKITNQL